MNEDRILTNRATRKITILFASQLAVAGVAFLTQLLLARGLPMEKYGALAIALASINLLTPLAGFGIGSYWLRIFGKEGWAGQRWIPSTTKLAGFSSIIIVIVIFVWAWSGVFDATTRILMSLLAITIIGNAVRNIGGGIFQLEACYIKLAIYHFLPHSLRFLVAILAFWAGLSVTDVATGYALTTLVIVGSYSRPLWRMISGRLALRGHGVHNEIVQVTDSGSMPSVLTALQGTWPFALSGLFHLIYFQSNIVLLGILEGERAAGIYNIAFSAMIVVYLFPSAIYQQYLMPHLHRLAEHNQDRFFQVYRLGGSTMLIASLAFMGLVAGFAPWIVPRLFGKAYHEAGTILAFLSLCIPLRFLTTNMDSILSTGGNIRRKICYQGIIAIFNVALNLVLIPIWGIFGAAVATVIAEFFLLLIYMLGIMRHIFGRVALSTMGPPPVWLSVLIWMGIVAFMVTRPNLISIETGLMLGSLATAFILALKYVRPQFYARMRG